MTDAFVTYLRAERRRSELTVSGYHADITEFLEYLGVRDADFEPSQVKAEDIREWIISMSEQRKLSPASINRKISAVRSFFRWLRATGVIEKNPCLKIAPLKKPRRLPVWIPEKQMDGIVDRMMLLCEEGDLRQRRDALIVLLFYSSGIRLAELVDIDADDLAADFRSLKVRGKGDKERVVPMTDVISEILKRYVVEINSLNIWNTDEKPLFLTEKGGRISRGAVYGMVRAQLEKLGVQGKRSPHILRHTFATHLLDNGADMREIQELLGHSSLGATQVYTHNSVAHLKKVYEGAHPRGHAETEKEEAE